MLPLGFCVGVLSCCVWDGGKDGNFFHLDGFGFR